MSISTTISIISVLIAFFSLSIVLLNRNDKFRPYMYVYFSSVRDPDGTRNQKIHLKNLGSLPGLVTNVQVYYPFPIYALQGARVFVPLVDPEGKIEKRNYINLDDELNRVCQNRTLLSGDEIQIILDHNIIAPNVETFQKLSLQELREKYTVKDLEVTEHDLHIKIHYRKTFKSLFFYIPKVDKFKEKLLILKANVRNKT